MRRLKTIALLWACSLAVLNKADAAPFPEPGQPITVVVGFAAGGGADASARIVTRKMGEILGTSFVIQNRGGAGGMVATAAMAEAKPDGYTLLWNGIGGVIFSSASGNLKIHDPFQFVTPVTQAATLCNVVVVGAHSPFKSLKELIGQALAHPGKYSYGTPGIGSAGWFTVQRLLEKTGIRMVHVPYKGGSQMVTDVARGAPDFGVVTVSTVRALGKDKLIPLAVTSGTRDPALPGVPTIAEEGVSGYNAQFWFGLLAPKGTPKGVVDKLNAAARQALNDPEVKAAQLRLGFISSPTTPDEFRKIIQADAVSWGKALQQDGK